MNLVFFDHYILRARKTLVVDESLENIANLHPVLDDHSGGFDISNDFLPRNFLLTFAGTFDNKKDIFVGSFHLVFS